jgi:hypothetical protein
MLEASSPFPFYFICIQILIINYALTMTLFVFYELRCLNIIVNILCVQRHMKNLMKNLKNIPVADQTRMPLGALPPANGQGPPIGPRAIINGPDWTESISEMERTIGFSLKTKQTPRPISGRHELQIAE